MRPWKNLPTPKLNNLHPKYIKIKANTTNNSINDFDNKKFNSSQYSQSSQYSLSSPTINSWNRNNISPSTSTIEKIDKPAWVPTMKQPLKNIEKLEKKIENKKIEQRSPVTPLSNIIYIDGTPYMKVDNNIKDNFNSNLKVKFDENNENTEDNNENKGNDIDNMINKSKNDILNSGNVLNATSFPTLSSKARPVIDQGRNFC